MGLTEYCLTNLVEVTTMVMELLWLGEHMQ
jgi:hypothetical protein